MNKKTYINSYNASNIKILKGLDAVKKRPGMYIGDTSDGTGLHHMVFEVLDNSIDESLSGFCKNIVVTIYKDNSISVLDDGRGIPVDIHNETGISAAELIMTTLHTGGKFDNNSYSISGGLHGVGISVVNALSKKLELIVYRDNKIFYQVYSFGVPNFNIKVIGKTNKKGTYIRFWPDLNIFLNINKFKHKILFDRLNQLSYLNCGLKIKLINLKKKSIDSFLNIGGIKSFLFYIIGKKKSIHKNIFFCKIKKKNFFMEVALKWVNIIGNKILCFTNNVPQIEGGTHLSGLKRAITRVINFFLEKELNYKKNKFNIIGDDTREGLFCILSIKIPDPKFSSQTKSKLISSEIKFNVESFIYENLLEYFLENPKDTKNIFNKIINSCKIRESIKRSKELYKKKINIGLSYISSKLADCQEKNSKFSEIFLVEGDSAGGSAKQSRNRINQAVLPLKGKILNVEKTNLDKILSSKEICSLISVLGCGILNKNFDLNKLRYNNIIIMTDADVDGAHIRTLLLAFFYRYMPDLIINGHLYIARPPLYRICFKNKEIYINKKFDLLKYKVYFSFKNICLYKNNKVILKSSDFIFYILKYLKLMDLIFIIKNNFSSYIFDSLMFFKYLNINNSNDYILWIKEFSVFLDKRNFFCDKIICEIIKKKNVFYKFKFTFIDGFYSEIFYLNRYFLEYEYINLLNLGKKLFFLKKNNNDIYILLNNNKVYLKNFLNLINFVLNIKSNNIFIQRYKGLGEMNPDQLWETTMNPKNRIISKIYIKDALKASNLFEILMGDKVDPRKKFIKENTIDINQIDI